MNVKEEKKELRKKIASKMKEASSLAIIRYSTLLQKDNGYCTSFLNRFPSYKETKTIFAYVSLQDEFPTHNLLKHIIKDGKHLALPVVDGKNLVFKEVGIKNDKLVPLAIGSYGIWEPSSEAPIIFPNKKAILQQFLPLTVVVPGRAFTISGERLGHGGGFYDRFFSALFNIVDRSFFSLIGVCFSFQILPYIPKGKYDVSVDKVFTEKI